MRGSRGYGGRDIRKVVHFPETAKPTPIVPKRLIRGISERVDCFGEIVVELNEAQARITSYNVCYTKLLRLNARAAKENLSNLTAIHAAPDDPRLPEPVDLVLLVDTYHHIGARPDYFARLRVV